jgi:chromosome segregation ATPase
MENLIIILSMLLNIALIIALAVYMKRFNKVSEDYKKCVNDYDKLDKMYDSKCIELKESRELTYSTNKKLLELNKEIEDHIITIDERQKQIVELIQKCDRQNAEIESLQSINNTLLNDNRKLSDELQEIKKPKHKKVSQK